MNTKKEVSFEVRLYIGSVEGYNGNPFTEDDLVRAIGDFQKSRGEDWTPVRVTPTRYVSRDYNERGWEVAAILYPRFPKSKIVIAEFMNQMAKFLLDTFKQNRITVMHPSEAVLYSADNAEENA